MSEPSIVDSVVGIIGLGSIIIGIITYSRAQVAKRADVLFPLIKEFDESESMEYAKKIMDGHPVAVTDPSHEFDNFPPKGLIKQKGPLYWNMGSLTLVLRDHHNREEGIITPEEDKIRRSFDSLLDFFCKLEYLLEIHLVTKREVEYFNYYINKIAKNDAILNYIKYYDFPLHGGLHKRLNTQDSFVGKYAELYKLGKDNGSDDYRSSTSHNSKCPPNDSLTRCAGYKIGYEVGWAAAALGN